MIILMILMQSFVISTCAPPGKKPAPFLSSWLGGRGFWSHCHSAGFQCTVHKTSRWQKVFVTCQFKGVTTTTTTTEGVYVHGGLVQEIIPLFGTVQD